MILRLAALLIALLPLSAVPAQPAAPAPAALDLARLLLARDESLYQDADLVRFQARIERDLATLEGGCDSFSSDCRGAATIVAREYAPAFRLAERERTERITALLLAESLRPEEMTRIILYVRGDEGGRFLDALTRLRDPAWTGPRRRALERSLARGASDPLTAARALFRQRTRNLPRAVQPR
jgi:hypothetical protein